MRSSYGFQRTVRPHATHARFAGRPRARPPWSTRCRPAGSCSGSAGAPGAGKSTLALGPRRGVRRPGGADGRLPPPDAELVARGPARPQGRAGDLRRRGVRRPAGPAPRPAGPRGDGARLRPGSRSSRCRTSIAVPPSAGLVVTEGNYLLLDRPAWPAVRAQLDAVWHVVTDEASRGSSGWSPVTCGPAGQSTDAREWVQPRRPAQRRTRRSRPHRADLVLDLTGWTGVRIVAASDAVFGGRGPSRPSRHGCRVGRRIKMRNRIICVSAVYAVHRHDAMTPDPTQALDAVHEALDAAAGLDADEALPHLREAADRLTELIDESMAEALLNGKASLRSAGAGAGLSENAVRPAAGPHPDAGRLRQRRRPGDGRRRRARQVRPRVRDAEAGTRTRRPTHAVQAARPS